MDVLRSLFTTKVGVIIIVCVAEERIFFPLYSPLYIFAIAQCDISKTFEFKVELGACIRVIGIY